MPNNKEVFYSETKAVAQSRSKKNSDKGIDAPVKRSRRNRSDNSLDESLVKQPTKNLKDSTFSSVHGMSGKDSGEDALPNVSSPSSDDMEIDQAPLDNQAPTPITVENQENWDQIDREIEISAEINGDVSDQLNGIHSSKRSTPKNSDGSHSSSLNDTAVEPPPEFNRELVERRNKQLLEELEDFNNNLERFPSISSHVSAIKREQAKERTIESGKYNSSSLGEKVNLPTSTLTADQEASTGKLRPFGKRGFTFISIFLVLVNYSGAQDQGNPTQRSQPPAIGLYNSGSLNRKRAGTMNEAEKARIEREAQFPYKMGVFVNTYHTDATQITNEDMRIICRYLEMSVSNYERHRGNTGHPEIRFSPITRIQAGMLVINCETQDAAKWLRFTIINGDGNEIGGLLGEGKKLCCETMEKARPHKTFIAISTDTADDWTVACNKLQGGGFSTASWHLLNTRVDSRSISWIFMDLGNSHTRFKGSRQMVFRSPLCASVITLKWLRGEDEKGNKIVAGKESKLISNRFLFKALVTRLRTQLRRSCRKQRTISTGARPSTAICELKILGRHHDFPQQQSAPVTLRTLIVSSIISPCVCHKSSIDIELKSEFSRANGSGGPQASQCSQTKLEIIKTKLIHPMYLSAFGPLYHFLLNKITEYSKNSAVSTLKLNKQSKARTAPILLIPTQGNQFIRASLMLSLCLNYKVTRNSHRSRICQNYFSQPNFNGPRSSHCTIHFVIGSPEGFITNTIIHQYTLWPDYGD